MGLESASFISSLVSTNPIQTDLKRQGDDHLRLLKAVLQGTFPNADKAFYFPTAEAKSANFTVAATDMGKTFTVSTAGGEVTGTLPALGVGDSGWECHFIKTNTGTNALFIAPDSGTLQSGEVSGLAQCRRVIPGHRSTAHWSGSAWFVSRVPNAPVGSCIEFHGATLPVGYEWPNGQTLASASTKYPEYNSVVGSGVTLDRCGRVGVGKDDMGEASNNRITAAGCGIDGDTLGAAGGTETHTLTTAQLAVHSHTATDSGHTHALNNATSIARYGEAPNNAMNTAGVGASDVDITAATGTANITVANAGSGEAHNNVQPSIVVNYILVVE